MQDNKVTSSLSFCKKENFSEKVQTFKYTNLHWQLHKVCFTLALSEYTEHKPSGNINEIWRQQYILTMSNFDWNCKRMSLQKNFNGKYNFKAAYQTVQRHLKNCSRSTLRCAANTWIIEDQYRDQGCTKIITDQHFVGKMWQCFLGLLCVTQRPQQAGTKTSPGCYLVLQLFCVKNVNCDLAAGLLTSDSSIWSAYVAKFQTAIKA